MKTLRRHRRILNSLLAFLVVSWQIGQPLQAATLTWTGTADTNWSNAANWIGGVPTAADDAVFGLSSPATVNLAGGSLANSLSFLDNYTLSGGTLALGSGGIQIDLGRLLTLNSQLVGNNGLLIDGGGTVRLGNASNTYTGTTTIANGSLIISHPGALGADTSAISILTNNNTPLNANLIGFRGGSLVLDGTAGGFNFARDINFEGRGPIGDRGAAIQSLGNNTLSGTLTAAVSPLPLSPTATFRNSRITSINGTLTLSGNVVSQGTSATTFLSLGGVNSAGVGDFNLTGALSGSGGIEKSGAGVLFWNPSSVSGFTGTVRVGGAATGQQSSVRVTQLTIGGVSAFGGNVGTNASSVIDMNGGVLEFRNEGNLDFNSLATGKNVYLRASSTFYTGPAVGGEGINGLTTLGTLRVVSNVTGTFNSRNGYGMTLGAWTQENSGNPNTITNNMGGTLTFTGGVWGNTDGTARTLTFNGGGNTVLLGSITASGANHILSKGGTGLLSIAGTASTYLGNTNITQGAIQIADFRSINNNTAAISLGNATTTAGHLIIGGVGTSTAAGLTTSKTITLNTTTASNSIYANQTGANPVILNGAITKIGAATSGALILGGTNNTDNIINVAIPGGGTVTGGVTKLGAGTWVLNAASSYIGATTIQNGTLKLRANAAASNVIPETGTNTIVFGANTTTGTAGGILEFRGFAGAATTETLGALTPTAGAGTVRLLGNGAAANLTFTSLGATTAASSVNFVTTGALGGTITLTGQAATTATTLPGTANFLGHLYINGADFATINASAQVVAPTYTTTLGDPFRQASSALIASVHNRLTESFTSAAATVTSLSTNSQTLTLSGNLTVSTGGILQSGGTATFQSDSATARTIVGGAAAANIAIRVDGVSDVLNLGAPGALVGIASTTTGGLTKNGAGSLVIFGTNAQTGAFTINEGRVVLNGADARMAASAGVATVLRQNTFLDFNTSASFAANPTVAALDGAGTIRNVGSADVTFVQTGAGTWAGSFNQTGTGVLNVSKLGTTGAPTWSGTSNYTGVTTIGGTTGSVTVDFLANGGVASGIGASTNAASNLVFSGTTAGLIYRGAIIEGELTFGSRSATTDRLFTLAGSGATLSSTVSNNNAIIWSNTGAIVHGTNADRTLFLAGTSTGDNTFNPQLSNSTGFVTTLTKQEAGQWNLGNSNNTYTGNTTVNNGILALNHNGALPAGSPLVLTPTSATSAAVFQMSGTFERSLTTTPTAGGGGLNFGFSIASTTGGVGFAAHTTPLVVAIGGIGSPTPLTWGSGGFVGTGGVQNLVLNSTTALSHVDFRNAIDLGATARTINVLDNGNTGADYATMSGVLSGVGAGLIKIGSGILRLTAANTYTGVTAVEAGTLVVSSLGKSTDLANTATSVGISGVAFGDANAIVLGNATTTGGILQYVGPGETSDRKIRLRGTTAGNQIHADGSGPLILTNVAHDTAETGNKTLSLRGSNAAGNMITSQLSDNATGVLSVTVDGNATWILTNSGNNYTGVTTVSAGALGIGHNTAIPAGLTISNGNVFAYGGDRVLTNTLTMGNNATSGFIGDYSLTFNGNNVLNAGANNLNLYNSVTAGKSVTLNGLQANALTANRTWTLDGPGETVLTGDFTTSTAFGVPITKNGDGTLVFGTNGTNSNWNQASAVITLNRGTIRFSASEAIPSATATNGGLVINPALAVGSIARLDLNGTTQTINALTAITDGTVIIDNTSANAAAFRFGANNTTVNFGSGLGSYSIQNTGTGALDLVKLGNTSTVFNSGITVGNKGVIASEGGGSFVIAGPVTAAGGLRAIGGSTLALTGGITNPALIKSIEVGAGSILSLLDGAGSLLNLDSLSLGNTGSGTVTLNLNVGDGATDTLTLVTGGLLSLGNTITFNMTDAGLSENTTYTLLNLADGGLSAFGLAKLIQGGTPGGFTSMNWFVDNNVVQLTTGDLIVGDIYWRGLTNTTWNGNVNNWSKDKAGTLPADSIPGAGNNVIFSWDNVGTGALTTTLEQNFRVNSLVFESGATTPSSVTLNSGAVAGNRLEIKPQVATDGIDLKAGGPLAVTIGTNLRLGANQTWKVADAAAVLTIGGSLLGQGNVTMSGAGKVVLAAAADPAFNGANNAAFSLTGVTLEMQNVGSLGTTANSNVASVNVGSNAAFYLNNATATTAAAPIANAITLSGGSLSLGGANHFIGPVLTVNSASTINLADSNGAPTATARSLTLNNGLSGAGNLTLNSNNAASSGNQIGGTLTLNQDNSAYTGSWNILRGSIATNNVNGLGTGNSITFEKGRIQFTGTAGTRTINHNILVASASETSVGELNFATGIAAEIEGKVTLGGTGGFGELRVLMSSDSGTVLLKGGVELANNGGLGTQNAATRVLTVDSVISETGGARSLTINDSAWGGTAGTVLLNKANTYTGGTILARGILQLGHLSALSSGPLTAFGASTLNSLVDLTGANALANALNLNAVLTFTGSNGFTFNGLTTNIGAGGLTNSLTAGNLLFSQVNLAEPAAAAARTLTIAGAGTGSTTITALLNNLQNNTLTNNLSASTLSIGTIALSETAGTGRDLTLSGTGSTVVTGVIENVVGGGGLAGSLIKAGTGTLNLQGANTFTGAITINAGVLQFSTVTNAGGAASNLGQGTVINLGGGTLSFIGAASQSTNRPISTTASSTLSANGTGGAIITYTGAISQAANNILTLAGTGEGIITGGIVQPAGAATADLSVTSGTWTIQDSAVSIADDLLMTGGTLTLKDMVFTLNDDVVITAGVLNLNNTGVLAAANPAGTSSGLHVRNGGIINLNANDVWTVAGGIDFINVGDATAGAAGVLNTNTFNLTSPGLLVGGIADGLEGSVTGTGTITVTSTATDHSLGIRTYRGSITANLAGVASLLKQGLGEVTLSGNNSGLTGTVAATRLDAGSLILDYTTQNNAKISSTAALDMRGGTLTLNGNNAAATSQTVGSFTLASGGANTINMNAGTGQTLTLNLGAITRAASAGTLRLNLGANTFVTTSTGLTNGLVVSGFATVDDGTGTWFATKSGSNIVALISTPKNAVTTWAVGDHVTDETTGFTGTVLPDRANINSLRFNATGGGNITIANGGILGITSGGILITDQVTGPVNISGGTLTGGVADVIITHDGDQSLTISSDIRINHGVTKAGTGTLVLSGNNVFTGQLQLQNGTLELSGGNAVGDNSVVTLSDDRVSTLRLLANETMGRLAGGSTSDGLRNLATVDVGSFTLTTNTIGTNTTYSGKFIGNGVIVKNGFGTNTNWNLNNSSDGFTGTLVVNGGLLQLSNIGRIDAGAFVINKNATLLIDNNGTTTVGTRILDTASITLNSADGANSGEVRPSGLWIRRDQGSTQSETVGVVFANSGASYVRAETTAASAITILSASNLVRSNAATMSVRGNGMSLTTGRRAQFRIIAANEAAFISTMIGGAGAAGTVTTSIVPWMIAEDIVAGGAIGDANMGNSLATYTTTSGFRPLNLSTEYATYATAGVNNNTRESLTASLTGLAGRTLNSLVIDNNNTATINVTGSGAGQSLTNTSGAFLFTISNGAASTAYQTTLGGFDSGILTPSGEYIFHVVNPSAAVTTSTLTATIASPLASVADITKSGRGTLVLTGTNVAGGGARRVTINEGTLQISDLDNIGGNSGALVFAGGTLRFGEGLTDDISTRTISFLQGGATIDTNGIALTLANSLGSGIGGFTKTGLGNLTLNGSATYTGNTVLSLGTLTIGANNALGNGGSLTLAAGTTLAFSASNSLTHGLISASGAGWAITGTGTLSASAGYSLSTTDATQIDALLAGSGGLLKTGAEVLTLTRLNTYTGTTEVQAGSLSFNSIGNVGGGPSALGNPGNVENGIIRMGLTTAATALTYTGSGHSTNRILALQGTTGGVTINADGTGALALGNVQGEYAGAKTLTLTGLSDSALINSVGAIHDGAATISVLKIGTNTWALNGSSTYTGATSLNDGVFRIGAVQNLSGALNFGSANNITTAGTLQVKENASFGSLTVQTNSDVNTNGLVIDAGKTLTINGNVIIGTGLGALTTTRLSATGGGALVVNNPATNGTFRVGGYTGSTAGQGNTAWADLSGLASLTVTLDAATGSFRVNNTSTANTNNPDATLLLPVNTTVTASVLAVGDGGQYNGAAGQINELRLGTGATQFNVNTINIGTGSRDLGSITFQGLNGTLTVRAADGIGAAAFNMGAGTSVTAAALPTGNLNTFDLIGHTADLLFGAVNIGTQNARTGALENLFAFDQGTLVAGNLTMGSKTAAGNSTNVMNLGGGTVSFGSGTGTAATLASNTSTGQVSSTINVSGGNVTIGSGSGQALILGSGNTNATGTATGILNVTGGTVTLATTGTTAVTLANASAGTSTGSINVLGGTLTLQGDIVRGTGAGTRNASVVLDGGTLDMGGFSVGTGANLIVFDVLSGSLKNLFDFNGGAVLEKTSSGVLRMLNGNVHGGGTFVNEGTLLAGNTSGSATGTGDVTVNVGAILGGNGIIAPAANNSITVLGTLLVGETGDTSAQKLTLNTTGVGLTTVNGVVAFDLFGGQGSGTLNAQSGNNDQLVVSGTSGFTIGGSASLQVTTSLPITEGTWAVGTEWKLFDWSGLSGGVNGTFSNLSNPAPFNYVNLPDLGSIGLAWDVSNLYTAGTIMVVAPEPGRMLLVFLGLMGLFFRRRRA